MATIHFTGNSARVTRNDLKDLKAGPATISLSRSSGNTLTGVTQAGGRILVMYFSTSADVNVTE